MKAKDVVIGLAAAAALSAALTAGIEIIHKQVPDTTTSAEGIVYQHVDAPEASNANGVVTAAEWASVYPEIVSSMEANADNTYRVSYLEEDPYLTNLYEGYGFAKDYTSAVGHNYCLEDVYNTERPHALANCLTCKTPDFTKMVNDMGDDAYTLDFEEAYAQVSENTSCYNCHENQAGNAGELVVTHSYVTKALGDNVNTIDAATLSCGQCHIEYYFDPETKATSMPYSSVDTMDPTSILNYYNEMGFSDWTQESTGTAMLKAQHPEMETFLQGVHASTMNCADCHMALTEDENGNYYHSHEWVSPLESEEILSTCTTCHGNTDMTAKVREIQEEITASEKEVGERLSTLKDTLAAAVSAGEMSEDQLDEVRSLYRDAQWYWDYCYVENSEGAHNSSLARMCLGTSSDKIDEAMKLLEA